MNISMKKIAILATLFLTACQPSYEVLQPQVTPPELADCNFIKWNPYGSRDLYIVRCPNSTTNTTWTEGKHSELRSVIVVDGKTYVEKE